MSAPFKLGMAQMLVEGGQKRRNLQRAQNLIATAASEGAEVVVLPEAMPLGWTHSSARTEAEPIPAGETCSMLSDLAKAHRIHICSGVIERVDDRIFNAAVLIGPDGNVLLHHRKLNELDIAHDLYTLGDRLQVVRTPLATFGLMICADAFVKGQVISRALGMMGVDVILSPCAWAVDADHDNAPTPYGQLWLDNYQPVARDFRLWVAGVSNVGWINDGPWKGRKCIGCSLLIDPAGTPVVRAPYGVDAETILYAEIKPQPRPAQGTSWENFWK
jgi:predicted amidohydrolase